MLKTKCLIFADGYIGSNLLDYILTNYRSHVSGVVLCEAQDGDVATVLDKHNYDTNKIYHESCLNKKGLMEELAAENFTHTFLLWWPKIVSKDILAICSQYTVNTHPSLLPYCKGKDPNFWALLTQKPFGVTLHVADPNVDSGPIIAQKAIKYNWSDTGESLYEKSLGAMISLFKDNYVAIISGQCILAPQPQGEKTNYRKDLEPASEILLDNNYRARDLLNLIRARTFNPHPGAWFEEDDMKWDVRISITPRK